MKLHLLESLIDRFLEYQVRSGHTAWYLPHSIVHHFHEVWNRDDNLSLAERYSLALKSDISQRWWKREHYHPKEIMLKLIEADAELATLAFKDLFNDTASLEGRYSRFVFYAEELLNEYKRKHPRDIETHHHQDVSIVSLYLAGRFPEKYILYPGLEAFQSFMRKVESPDYPSVDDIHRYMKVAMIVHKFLLKNPSYPALEISRTESSHKVKFLPLQLSYELISFAGNNSVQS
jgi:hypothetical protein